MQSQPVAVNVVLGGVLSTGVTLAALLWPGIDTALQVAIVAFGNSLIGVLVWYLSQRVVTPIAAPRLELGTEVTAVNYGQPIALTTPEGNPIGTNAKVAITAENVSLPPLDR